MKNPFTKENEQYIPSVSGEDIERILCREFSESEQNKINELLKNINQEPRVIAACLKNSGGNIKTFKNELKTAEIDYRDVLIEAEYPHYSKETYNNSNLSVSLLNELIKKDKEQYLLWFN